MIDEKALEAGKLAFRKWLYDPPLPVDCVFDEGLTAAIEAYLRALPASGGERVAVKPLEWHGDEAITPFGRYKVIRTEDGYEAAFEWDELAHVGFNAADDARRAAVEHAEADYEARIRALSLQQGEVEPVGDGAIRICPERDSPCPHGMSCPYTDGRWMCDIEASRAALTRSQP